MKYQRILAVFFILLFFTHCEKDENQYGYIRGVLTGPEGVIAEVIVQVVKNQQVHKEVVTDDSGAFNIKIAPGVYTLKISIEGYEDISETITVNLGEELSVDVDLNEITKILGILTDTYTSLPVADATVSIMSLDMQSIVATTTTNNVGRFSFGDIPDGNYQLYYYTSNEGKYMPVKIEGETKLSLDLMGSDYSELTETEINQYFSFLMQQGLLSYCNAYRSWSAYATINELTVNNKSVYTGGNGSYTNLTNNTFIVHRNKVNEAIFDLTMYSGWSQYGVIYAIWVDLNKDGDFTDSNEKVFSANNPAGYNTHDFTIDENIDPVYTTMRVAINVFYTIYPCSNVNYGEYEDYGVLIL
jgi:hypothetical protein